MSYWYLIEGKIVKKDRPLNRLIWTRDTFNLEHKKQISRREKEGMIKSYPHPQQTKL
jgi:hypothetical protein